MAETKDPIAHLASLNVLPNSIAMLDGRRYHQRYRFEANQYFKIPTAIWNVLKDDPSNTQHTFNDGHTYTMLQIVKWYLKQHFYHQLNRILDLERYYMGDNDIHYWKSNKIKRADNRIADNYPRYITNFDAGFLTGKPIKYSYSDKDNDNDDGSDLLNEIKSFNNFSDTRSHDELITKDMLNTGRAYELEYVAPNTTKPKVTRIDPNQCFVIWSTDVDAKELCGVRYTFNRIENNYDYTVEIYTDDKIFTFDAGSDVLGGNWNLIDTEDTAFGGVPITEIVLNKERMGVWEPELDDIDALDKALSEMANSQEDFSNATLVIEGAVKRPSDLRPIKDGRGRQYYYENGHYQDLSYLTLNPTDDKGKPNRIAYAKRTVDTNSNVVWLMPSTDSNGDIKSQPQIKYLTKQLDVNEWTAYVNKLESRIEKFTGVPDMNTDQSSSNQTDYETAMKFIHAIENSSNIESNFRHGIIRRLHLLVNYLNKLPGHFTSNDTLNNPDDVTVHFDFNVPLDIQSTIQEMQALVQTGDFSKQTIQEMGAKLTGVSPDEENNRLNSQNADQQSANSDELQSNFKDELNRIGMGSSNATNNAISNSNVDNQSSLADNNALSSSEIAKLSQSSSASKPQSDSSLNSNQLAKQSSANSTGNSLINSYLAETASDSQMADNDLKYMTEYVDSNGSTVSFDNPRADNMLPTLFLMDSLYGNSGYPSGWDSIVSSAVSVAMTSSMASAFAQSATDPGSGDVSDNDSDDYIDSSASSSTSSSSDQS